MKSGLSIFAMLVISFIQAADRRETVDFKTFNPEQYFKHGLSLDTKGKVARADLEKYCDRLHQFLTLLFCQERLIKLFCAVIPEIGPSEKYEKYRFFTGAVFDGVAIEEDFPAGFIDLYELGRTSLPNQRLIFNIKSLPGISFALAGERYDIINSESQKRILLEIAQKKLEKSTDDPEILKIAGYYVHVILISKILKTFILAPTILRRWTDLEMINAHKAGVKVFPNPDGLFQNFFPQVSPVISEIPLFLDIVTTYVHLMQAYANSGPLESATGVQITPEFKEVKREMGLLLDKMQKYTGSLSEKYMLAKKALMESRNVFKSQPLKYLSYSKEFIPDLSSISESGDVENRWDDLPENLDFDCIRERLRPKKQPIKTPVVIKQPDSVDQESVANISQPDNEKAAEKITYHSRIMDWLKPEFTKDKSDRSILYHTFSFLADPIIKKLGKKSTFITKERKHHPTYHLVGEIEYLSGQKKGEKELYVFVNTYDQNDVMYHRGIEPIKKDENFFKDFFSKSYAGVEDPTLSAQTAEPTHVSIDDHDTIISENDYSVVIYDSHNNVRITLLKPVEGLSYN